MIDDYPERADIRDHYDRLSPAYRMFWGEHLHHGFWENGDETQPVAQIKLIERLAARARIAPNSRVLDIGCGLGGSSRWLAQNLNCSVLGLTLSPVQAKLAAEATRKAGLSDWVHFEVQDATKFAFPPQSFDAVWVVECSEHLPDKARFIANCAQTLKPGGHLALCAWLRAESLNDDGAQLVAKVCEGMLCPSLASSNEYTHWMHEAGLQLLEAENLTRRVEQTWKHCIALLKRPEIQAMLRVGDARLHRFATAFTDLAHAYETGAMEYGMFAAEKVAKPSET